MANPNRYNTFFDTNPSEYSLLLPPTSSKRKSSFRNCCPSTTFGQLVLSVTAFILVSAITLLTIAEIGPVQEETVSVLKETYTVFPIQSQERIKLIRRLSTEAGLPQTEVRDEEVCHTKGCLDAAYDLVTAINGSVDPCSDFFQFSCGGWLKKNPVPLTSSRWSRFNRLRDVVNNLMQEILNEPQDAVDPLPLNQAKQYFLACMDTEAIENAGLEPLRNEIREVGGWQLLNPEEWKGATFDLLRAIADVRRKAFQSAILNVYVSADIKNTDRKIIYIDQPNFGLPRGILTNRQDYPDVIAAYETFITDVAKELHTTQNEEQLRSAAREIIDFEEKLAKISSSDEDRYDMDRIYNPTTLRQYQRKTDMVDRSFQISWEQLLRNILEPAGISDLSSSEPLIVKELEYVNKLIPILAEESAKNMVTVDNYIFWRLVSGMIVDTTEAMRNINFKFQKVLTGAKEQTTRKVTCANAGNGVFGMAIGLKYVERAFDDDAKQEVNSMVENLQVAFERMIHEADWMEETTKENAIEKKKAMRTFMAYPDWLSNKTELEKYYEGLEIGKAYFETQILLAKYKVDKELKGLWNPTDREEWNSYPGIVNAFYSPEMNSITFPAGILQPPFFGGNRPKHQNYGGIGVVIGHEVTHGFDNQGAQFDKNGNAENWWDDATKKEYNRRARCMSDQYSKFCYDFDGLKMCVNGELTLGENIGDNGGLRESFRAYQKYIEDNGPELKLPGFESFSAEKLFFLGYANIWCESITTEGLKNQLLTDPHSPAEWRVKGVIRNSMDFAKVYDCPVQSDGMNPPTKEKCTVW